MVGVLGYDERRYVCFCLTRQGDRHSPEQPQLRSTVGSLSLA